MVTAWEQHVFRSERERGRGWQRVVVRGRRTGRNRPNAIGGRWLAAVWRVDGWGRMAVGGRRGLHASTPSGHSLIFYTPYGCDRSIPSGPLWCIPSRIILIASFTLSLVLPGRLPRVYPSVPVLKKPLTPHVPLIANATRYLSCCVNETLRVASSFRIPALVSVRLGPLPLRGRDTD
ncbi:hypothetical protein E2C01_053459 [Portunus trituberculatus]|uniref:Uncharacterized protein n=1 Tax=Portunus trituberculatus TaxID=210409 RepID=A0A5B7GGM4_PORTR|nr:hypothetical protein [Portunus trituberculatus]